MSVPRDFEARTNEKITIPAKLDEKVLNAFRQKKNRQFNSRW